MNLKKAKAMRIVVRQMIKMKVIEEPWAQYGKIDHKKSFWSEKEQKQVEYTVPQFVVMPNSPKGVYKRMKRHGLEAVLTGKA